MEIIQCLKESTAGLFNGTHMPLCNALSYTPLKQLPPFPIEMNRTQPCIGKQMQNGIKFKCLKKTKKTCACSEGQEREGNSCPSLARFEWPCVSYVLKGLFY